MTKEMMIKMNGKFFLACIVLLGIVLCGGGCTKDDSVKNSSFAVSFDPNTVSATSVDVNISSTGIVKYAYTVNPAAAPNDAALIFAAGTVENITSKKMTVTLKNLNPETDYTVWFAAQIDSNSFFKEVKSVSFRTKSFDEEGVTLFNVTPYSYSIAVNLPANVASRVESGESAIRSATTDILTYNLFNNYYPADAEKLAESGRDAKYPDNIHRTASFIRVFDEEHMTSDVVDEIDGMFGTEDDEAYYYNPIVPGQPAIVMLGEFAYKGPDYDGDPWVGYRDAAPYFDYESFYADLWGGGILLSAPVPTSSFLSSNQEKYWSGFYKRLEFTTEAPAKLDAQVRVETELTPTGGQIRLAPEAGVYQYLFTLTDLQTYYDLVDIYLNGHEEFLQWAVTSYAGTSILPIYNAADEVVVDIASEIEVEAGSVVKLLVVGMGDERGLTQNYAEYEFMIPESLKPAPQIEVKAIPNPNGEESPYEVWFNIKRVGDEPVAAVQYAANYKEEWETMLNMGYTYDDVAAMGNYLSTSDMYWVNDPDGYDIAFSTRDEATTLLAVRAMHDEGVYCKAVIAEATSAAIDIDPVESDLYTALEGDWTMTVPLESKVYDWDVFDYVTKRFEITGKVTVGNLSMPSLTADDYAVYADLGMDKAEVDGLYASLNENYDAFLQKTRRINRILMNGFEGNIDSWSNTNAESLAYMSPYDLFVSLAYSGSVASMVRDFGPKWYIELHADGTATVPVNYLTENPLANTTSTWYHFLAADYEGDVMFYNPDNSTINVPVEVSDDRNTIIVKPYNYRGKDYYLCCGSDDIGSGYLTYAARTVGDIVLTRGWAESRAVNGVKPQNSKHETARTAKPAGVAEYKLLDRTPVVKRSAARKVQTVKAGIATPEMLRANAAKYAERLHAGADK